MFFEMGCGSRYGAIPYIMWIVLYLETVFIWWVGVISNRILVNFWLFVVVLPVLIVQLTRCKYYYNLWLIFAMPCYHWGNCLYLCILSQPLYNCLHLCSVYKGLLLVVIFAGRLVPGVGWLAGIVCILLYFRLFTRDVRVCSQYIYIPFSHCIVKLIWY